MVVVAPENLSAAVQALPDGQRPYGSDCKIRLKIQAVLFHYGIHPDVVKSIAGEGFELITDFRLANPRGDADQKELFDVSIAVHIKSALQKARLLKAFERLMREHPMQAVVVGPPPKTSKSKSAVAPVVAPAVVVDASAGVVASGPASVADVPSASGSVSAKRQKRSTVVSSSDDSDDSDSDGCASGGAADDGDEEIKDSTSSVKKASISQLFEKVDTEVFLVGGLIVSMMW